MSRMLWFAAGAGAGVYGMIRGRRAKEAVSPEGLKDRIGALAVGARIFRDEVAQGSVDAENDMRRRLGLVSTGTPELASSDLQPDLHPDPLETKEPTTDGYR